VIMKFTYELEPHTAELLNLIANISHVGKLHDVMQLEKRDEVYIRVRT
jgi:hypothetical protein